MKYLGKITDNKDLVTKEYVDNSIPTASSTLPVVDGTASTGSETAFARGDHVHPSDTSKASVADLATVAFSGDYDDLIDKPTIPPTMSVLSYGHSTWADFLAAYSTNTVVYCRASSNSNPATGSQTRMAFMAYVNNGDPASITNVEFQYYRSVNTHSASQQGDQVYIYKLDKTAGWTVTIRESYSKIATGTGLTSSYSSGTITLSSTLHGLPAGGTSGQILTKSSATDYDVGWTTLDLDKFAYNSSIVVDYDNTQDVYSATLNGVIKDNPSYFIDPSTYSSEKLHAQLIYTNNTYDDNTIVDTTIEYYKLSEAKDAGQVYFADLDSTEDAISFIFTATGYLNDIPTKLKSFKIIVPATYSGSDVAIITHSEIGLMLLY